MTIFTKAIQGLYKSLVIVQTALLGLLLAIVSLQVITRLFPFIPHFLWTEEIARFLLIWVIFLGASLGVKEWTHFTVSLLPESKSGVFRLIWDIAIIAGISVISGIFAYRGLKYALVMIWDISDIAQISMIWVGAAIPVFGVLSLLFLIEKFIEQLHKEG